MEREDDLGSVDPHFALLELLSLVKVGEQLPATHIICKSNIVTKNITTIVILVIILIVILSLTED